MVELSGGVVMVLLQIELPKVLNALLAVLCDVYVFKLGCLLYGTTAGYLAVSLNPMWLIFKDNNLYNIIHT